MSCLDWICAQKDEVNGVLLLCTYVIKEDKGIHSSTKSLKEEDMVTSFLYVLYMPILFFNYKEVWQC